MKAETGEARYVKWARELEKSGDYRILRRIPPRPVEPAGLADGEKLGVIADVETTGLDHTKDEIIELGMIKFAYDDKGAVRRVLGVFSELRQPSSPIPAEITLSSVRTHIGIEQVDRDAAQDIPLQVRAEKPHSAFQPLAAGKPLVSPRSAGSPSSPPVMSRSRPARRASRPRPNRAGARR